MTVKRKKNVKVLASLETLADFGNTSIEVGWIDPRQEHEGSDLKMAHLAAVQEYGAKTKNGVVIPPRPMLRTSVRKKAKEWIKQAAELSKALERGAQINADAIFGGVVAESIKSVISDKSNWKPNAPSTARKKGMNWPLIDTRNMVNAVSFRVHKGKIK